jgi:hypothetical protein
MSAFYDEPAPVFRAKTHDETASDLGFASFAQAQNWKCLIAISKYLGPWEGSNL